MQERIDAGRLRFRVLVAGDRVALVGVLFVGIVAALILAGILLPRSAVLFTSGDPVETVFQAFIGATITGVTLVVTLNQLVLSQEFGAVGDQQDRLDAAVDFREDVDSVLDTPISPLEPSAFLRALIDATGDHARALRENVDDDLRDRVRKVTDDIETNAQSVSDALKGANFGTFAVMSAALDYDYSRKLYSARRLRAEDADTLSAAGTASLDGLIETLELYGPAREHFKTLYIQWELTGLSRVILAASLPSLVVSVAMVLFYDPAAVAGSVAGVPLSLLVACASVGVALIPFLVLLSYVLRIATVTQRTLSIGPFTLRETERSPTDRE
jgi:hypothetical protein